MTLKDDMKELSQTLQRYRDEVRVQLHLARQDVKDEWDDLDVYWQRFRSKVDDIVHDAEDTSQEARQSVRELGDELRKGYERLSKRLK